MASTRPFRAFVSYCHKDKAFAAWLQRKLEGYRLPKRLAGQVEPLPGQAPGRIGPVFRDREDLSAATDLSAAVREAIAASSALVVVASPDAARSHWVAREISLFRELHPGAPVLVALARGEPAESIPEALRTSPEPLAADFRKQGDGKRLAFLKIVAGLAGLPLDELVQRDSQRRLRSVTAVTVGASILVIVMALLLAMALRARDDAERHRAEAESQRSSAEGLVEYMLTDLRERLRGVGRPDVMSEVDMRAMAHYRQHGDLSRLSDDSLNRRARVLHAMGEDDEKLGHFNRALTRFVEAHRTTAAVLVRHPEDADTVYAHAQSEYWIGYAAWRKRDRATATRHWHRYHDRLSMLARLEPGSVRSHVELGYAEGNLCDLNFSERHNLVAAQSHCTAGVAHFQAAAAAAPGDRKVLQDLANRHGWLARVQAARKRYERAAASRQREIAILDRLLEADPANAEYGLRRSWPDIGLAYILMETGRPADASLLLKRRWDAFRPHLTSDKSNQYWESGIRVIFYLVKAERLAGQRHNDASLIQARALERSYLELFPDRKSQIQALIKDIS